MANIHKQLEGLSADEAILRLEKFGPNIIKKPSEVKFWNIVKEEVTEPMILLLLGVVFFYFLWGSLGDAFTILGIIIILVFVDIWSEYHAKKAISALSKIASPKTKVIRSGQLTEAGTETIVPGDVLVLSIGTRIAADSRVNVSYSLQVEESSLTGESFPVDKKQGDDIYAGSLVVFGEGKAEVFATGNSTKIGRISDIAQTIKEPKTPLQLSMKALSKVLALVAIFFSVTIPALGILRNQDPHQMILTGLALAFATIPEELPIVVTMVLGLGSYSLSKKNFLIKKIKAAEILGSATVILTDKTGTITENEMKVVSVFPRDKQNDVIKAAFSVLTEISLAPTEKAIMDKARELKIAETGEIIRERSFGGDRKSKAIIREFNGAFTLVVNGAPEEILARITGRTEDAEKEIIVESSRGRRLIAVAQKNITAAEKDLPFEKLEQNLTFVGLISLEDPPRAGVKETIEKMKSAGIKTIMVTGDHPKTALFIARSVGIKADAALTGSQIDALSNEELKESVEKNSVFARTSPEQKYRLVKALQQNKEIVAVTGDGVNDTLALKGADIGIAMGIRGTDAAKEAADIVLADDNFVTIGQGVFEGRKLFDNLSKGIKYYLSVKLALILVFLLPVIAGIPLPFSPIQIIVLELFMDLAASAGFVSEPAEENIYRHPPRNPQEQFLNTAMVKKIIISGLSLFAAVITSYFFARSLNVTPTQVQTLTFSAWIIGHIFLALTSRSDSNPLYKIGFFTNKIMVIWAVTAFAFLAFIIIFPAAHSALDVTSVAGWQIATVAAFAFVAIFWQEAKKIFSER